MNPEPRSENDYSPRHVEAARAKRRTADCFRYPAKEKPDFAKFIQGVVEHGDPDAETVRLVLDNLNTHFEKSFTETFSKKEAERILKKIEFHYTPTHASWLNMAEIEIDVMDAECLGGRRIPDEQTLVREVAAWSKRRNEQKKTIVWKFTKQDADKKLSKYYIA